MGIDMQLALSSSPSSSSETNTQSTSLRGLIIIIRQTWRPFTGTNFFTALRMVHFCVKCTHCGFCRKHRQRHQFAPHISNVLIVPTPPPYQKVFRFLDGKSRRTISKIFQNPMCLQIRQKNKESGEIYYRSYLTISHVKI